MDTLLWVAVVFLTIFLLFVVVYALLAFDELIHDHKNPSDVCRNINPVRAVWPLSVTLSYG